MFLKPLSKINQKFGQKSIKSNKKVKNLAKNPSKIINHDILHTPTNVGVMVRKTFSHTLDEAMSCGLAKACDQR